MSIVTVNITNGPSIDVEWFSNMNTQQALEGAFNQQSSSDEFSFALQYYGTSLGYLVNPEKPYKPYNKGVKSDFIL